MLDRTRETCHERGPTTRPGLSSYQPRLPWTPDTRCIQQRESTNRAPIRSLQTAGSGEGLLGLWTAPGGRPCQSWYWPSGFMICKFIFRYPDAHSEHALRCVSASPDTHSALLGQSLPTSRACPAPSGEVEVPPSLGGLLPCSHHSPHLTASLARSAQTTPHPHSHRRRPHPRLATVSQSNILLCRLHTPRRSPCPRPHTNKTRLKHCQERKGGMWP